MRGWNMILKCFVDYANGIILRRIADERAQDDMSFNWKRILGFNQEDVLGMDIGSSSVRMIQLAKNGDGYTVVAAYVSDIKQDNDNRGVEEDNIVQAVQKCMIFAKKNARWAVCSVSGPEVAVRPFKFPPLQTEELDGAVRLEASQVCPFNVDDGVVDYQIVPSGGTNDALTGVLVAAPNDVIRRKVRIMGKAALDCVLMDVDGLALLNCLIESKNSGTNISTSAVLHIGTSCTTLAVMGETGLPFIRTVPYAGNDIVAQIAQENNVRPEVVRNEIYGCTSPVIPPQNLQTSMEKACVKLVNDVAETLRYHSTQDKSSPVEQLLVCGTFGMVKGFVDILNKQLPIKAVLWNPFDTMKCSVDRQCLDIIQSKGPAMVVAAGLAMRSV
jgi:type IV pilus assembly protein PilM